jgi:hypothetical protein
MDGRFHKRDAILYMLKANLPSQLATPPTKIHHVLLYAGPMTIDERPHNFLHLVYLLISSFFLLCHRTS